MATSPRMRWPYPSEGTDPWYDSFVALVNASDASAYASFESRGTFITGGGNFTFNASTGAVSSVGELAIQNIIAGSSQYIDGVSVTLQEGQFAYVTLVRGALSDYPYLTVQTAFTLPNNNYDNVLILCVRLDSRIYFCNGAILQDGDSEPVFEANSGGGGAGTVTSVTAGIGLSGGTITTAGTIDVVYGSAPNTACEGDDARLAFRPQRQGSAYNVTTTQISPLYQVVGAFPFNGTDYTGRTVDFTAVGYTSAAAGVTMTVQLWDIATSTLRASATISGNTTTSTTVSSITATTDTLYEIRATLTAGAPGDSGTVQYAGLRIY